MKTILIMGAAMMIVGSAMAPEVAQSQQPGSTQPTGATLAGTKRTDLQRHDLSAPGREVIQTRVEFEPGYVSPKHWHPGEEIIYVLEGTLEYSIVGQPPKTYKAGDALTVPAEKVHWVKNVGTDHGAELATYIVEKGKPLITLVK
jgi:quercetin dioxygenase-like cupin family protein